VQTADAEKSSEHSTEITESSAFRCGDRGRLFWSLLASAILHIFTWAALMWSGHLSFLRNVQTGQPRETIMVSLSPIRIERRAVPQPQRRPKIVRAPHPKPPRRSRQPQHMVSAPPQGAPLSPPQPAALFLPPSWAKQDFGNKAATDTTLWLDWTKQSGSFVPRVFLWQMKAVPGYMRGPSLQDAVQDVLASLRARDAKVYISKPQRVCSGKRLGWFFSYVKPSDDRPLHYDETLFMAGDTIYRATYIRRDDQPEDTKTREGLNSLCHRP
jgi:hypothetical protein